jgi:hypothetical protein
MAGSIEPVGSLKEEKVVMMRSSHTIIPPQAMRIRFSSQSNIR